MRVMREYIEDEKSFLDEIKNFFIVFEGFSFDEKIKNLIKTVDRSYKRTLCKTILNSSCTFKKNLLHLPILFHFNLLYLPLLFFLSKNQIAQFFTFQITSNNNNGITKVQNLTEVSSTHMCSSF